MDFPLTATGTPFWNFIVRYTGLLGRFFVFTQMNASSGGSLFGFSNTPPSIARPHKFWSILNFFATFSISIPCFFANFSSSGLLKLRSRIGAIIGRSEPACIVKSNLTWSLPLPEHPCASALTFSFFAICNIFLAINGRASAVARQYFFWYNALAYIAGNM